MFTVLAAALSLVAQDADIPSRDWRDTDALVSFMPDSRMETPVPIGSWTGRASMTVRCMIMETGQYDACRVIGETPPRQINARTAIRAFRNARLDLSNPAGPRAGDTITTELILNRAWIRR
ncbi:hypothetical protein [Brevundimonas sp. UBA2416]|uniref:hypothetical protein n=1 Tax=Brevundimonas sp. UBA2416 TaxID=1946124 RepID=UPI0025BB8450|nr:hypothetical protein [Brevundimonas sp. UBA2416]HRJ64295.1 hypothetical protein [Brevundimonas sp.]